MKFRSTLLFALAFSLILGVSATAVADDSAVAPEGLQEYAIDTAHSSLVFRIMHQDTGYVFGMFRGFDGSFTLDDDNLEESSFEFTIEANSIYTNNETRDNHLKSPDFFAAEEHPELTFRSTNIERVNERTYRITGDMTIRGTTEEIEIMADQTGQGLDNADRFRRGFLTTFAVNRMDFGVDEMPEGLGHYVRVNFSIQGYIPEE
jgi:polyisoprenoid-binding protein YceI